MKPSSRSLALAVAVATALAGPASAQGLGQGQAGDEVVATYGDWDIRCATERDVCVMHQVGKGEQGNDVIEVRIRKLEGVTGENGQPVPAAIQIAAPLGVALQRGVRVQVDGGEGTAFPYQLCVQGGCISRGALSRTLVERMKAGATATFTVVAANGNSVPVDISLSGFTRSFGELSP